MRYTAAIAPSGTLRLVEASDPDSGLDQAEELPPHLVELFAASSSAGLSGLASQRGAECWSAAMLFWRSFGQRYFRALCRQYSQAARDWTAPHPPDEQAFNEVLEAAPPMQGLEFLTADALRRIWHELDEFTRKQVAAEQYNLAGYLARLDPAWNLVGRVTFHLAENKKDDRRPFAFLATYTQRQSQAGSPQHIPLAEALKQSLKTKDTQRMDELLEPVSRAATNSTVVARLLESRRLFAPQSWSIADAYEFLSQVPRMEDAGIIVRVPNWWNAARPPRPQVTVQIGAKPAPTLGLDATLDFAVGVAIDGEPLSDAELKQLLATRHGLTLLRGKWVEVDSDRLQAALAHWNTLAHANIGGVDFLQGMRLLAGATMDGNEADSSDSGWTRVEPGPWLQQTLDQLRDPRGMVRIDTEQRLRATLRPYQVEGVRWLWFATQLGLGVCLADDMGLGKTIQIIALLLQRKFPQQATQPPQRRSGPRARVSAEGILRTPSLLVVPTSLMGNWQREVARFAPDLKMFVAHRSVNDAAMLQRVADDPAHTLSDYDLVATTYGLVRSQDWLREVDWQLVVLDEAQAIKNPGAAQSKAVKKLRSAGRILLTGTPVENHLGDLWSLFDFCSPGLLGTMPQLKKLVDNKDQKARSSSIASIRRLIRPYVLRRMKTDPQVAPDLPAKTEIRVDCGLSPKQAALYQQVLKDVEAGLSDAASGIQRRGLVLSMLMQLKQICNHPSLYLRLADFADRDSGKFVELREIAELLRERQEKMLVFTQFQSMCEPLHWFLRDVFRQDGLVLTGQTAAARRGKLVAEFQRESGPPYFVISVKAGGTGLNLTQACHVLHFDRWWNPAVENQATDRAFRIGQTRNVLVHKFVCRGTLEERIDALIESKKELSEELFGTGGELKLTEMSDDQLMNFVSLDLQKASI